MKFLAGVNQAMWDSAMAKNSMLKCVLGFHLTAKNTDGVLEKSIQ